MSNQINFHYVDWILLNFTVLIVCKITLRHILSTFWRCALLPLKLPLYSYALSITNSAKILYLAKKIQYILCFEHLYYDVLSLIAKSLKLLASFGCLEYSNFWVYTNLQGGVVYSNKVVIMSSVHSKGRIIRSFSHGLEHTLSIHK